MRYIWIALTIATSFFIATVQHVYANVEQSDDDYFYAAPKALFLSDLDQEEEAFSYGIDAGYQWNKYFRTEFGVSNLRSIIPNNDDLIGYNTALVGVLPLSKFANINLGIGPMYYDNGEQGDIVAIAKLNIEYGVTDTLDLVFGYRYFHSLTDSDLYAYEFGIKYNFGLSDASNIQSALKLEPELEPDLAIIVAPSLQDLTPVPQVQELVDCESEVIIKEHIVSPGDYLMKISRLYKIKFKDLKVLNPKYFKNRNPDVIYAGELVKLDVVQNSERKRNSCDG